MPPSGSAMRCCTRSNPRRNGRGTEISRVEKLRDENFGQLSVGGSVETTRLVAIIAIIAAICLQNEGRDFSCVYSQFSRNTCVSLLFVEFGNKCNIRFIMATQAKKNLPNLYQLIDDFKECCNFISFFFLNLQIFILQHEHLN